MSKAKVDRLYTDHGVSGTIASRPELDKALDRLERGDTSVLWKLDRLGRNTRNVLEVIEQLIDRGVTFKSLTEQIDLGSGPMGKAMITILAAFAELEREVIVQRTRAGVEAARARGRIGGRPSVVDEKKMTRIKKLVASGRPHSGRDRRNGWHQSGDPLPRSSDCVTVVGARTYGDSLESGSPRYPAPAGLPVALMATYRT